MPKYVISGPRAAAAPKMAPKIAHLTQKCSPKIVWRSTVRQIERPKCTQSIPRPLSMDFAWIWSQFFMILDRSRPLFRILARFRHPFFASFSQDAKSLPRTSQRSRKEPSPHRTPQNMILQIAIRITPSTANKGIPRNKMGGGGVTPHGAFNPLRARGRPRRV